MFDIYNTRDKINCIATMLAMVGPKEKDLIVAASAGAVSILEECCRDLEQIEREYAKACYLEEQPGTTT